MIIGIGTDIVEIERIKKACKKQAFLERCFTEAERELIRGDIVKAASNWAVKESVGKMFGTGISGFEMQEVEVLRTERKKPYVVLHKNASRLAEGLGVTTIHVSISHLDKYAIAYVVGEGNDND